MTFDEALAQVLDLLQREGRVSYRALKRRFNLDDDYLEDLKAEIIQAKRLAIDEDGVVLVWIGAPATGIGNHHGSHDTVGAAAHQGLRA
jgi:hypothetical protein